MQKNNIGAVSLPYTNIHLSQGIAEQSITSIALIPNYCLTFHQRDTGKRHTVELHVGSGPEPISNYSQYIIKDNIRKELESILSESSSLKDIQPGLIVLDDVHSRRPFNSNGTALHGDLWYELLESILQDLSEGPSTPVDQSAAVLFGEGKALVEFAEYHVRACYLPRGRTVNQLNDRELHILTSRGSLIYTFPYPQAVKWVDNSYLISLAESILSGEVADLRRWLIDAT